MPLQTPALWLPVGIGVAAGFFSALFGVGGGIVTVPLLILLAGFGSHRATATSLAAIGLTALSGTAAFAVLGEVHWPQAAAVGLPAMVGIVLGIELKRRLSSRTLTLLFALFLAVISLRLFLVA